ncbi:MAG: hypothetical protein LBJ08_05885 [Bifidobacteriaceae bacterium]|jgi:hypothetical protein|nr:hypothetical protein [Bifidobacteriaceae bacterium]
MRKKTNAIIHTGPLSAADYTGKEGYFVNADWHLSAAATDTPLGVISEVWDDESADVAIAGAASGTYLVKLGAAPGSIDTGSILELEAGGTVKLGDGTGTPVARALEPGLAGELIEAVLLHPVPPPSGD